MYYTDPETSKAREIDVYAAQVLDQPRRHKGTGAPLINMYVFCECKSLAGSNILLSQGPAPEYARLAVMSYWVGNDGELRRIIRKIAEQARVEDHKTIKALYDYAVGRAYSYRGRALSYPVSMPPPPVDLIARSFRETKGGEDNTDRASDQSRATPVWNAVRTSLSAIQAAEAKVKDTSLDYVCGLELMFHGIDKFREMVAFFLDAELLRNCFFHPFVVLNARLWHLNGDRLEEANSARLYISSIEHGHVYVDIVNEKAAERYIKSMISHYNKAARSSVSKLWKMMERIEWQPGQAEDALGKALGQVYTGNS